MVDVPPDGDGADPRPAPEEPIGLGNLPGDFGGLFEVGKKARGDLLVLAEFDEGFAGRIRNFLLEAALVGVGYRVEGPVRV